MSRRSEPDSTYTVRVVDAISNGVVHHWPKDGSDQYNQRIPRIVRPFYAEKAYDERDQERMQGLYRKSDNVVYENIRAYGGVKYTIEQIAYIAEWVVPILLVLPCVVGTVAARRRLCEVVGNGAAQA